MEGELEKLTRWINPLITALTPAQQAKLARNIGQKLRRSQAGRIARQQNPDGTPFAPRKKQSIRERSKAKRGRIRQSMFLKLKTSRLLRVSAGSSEVAIGFIGRTARIARVHQEGLRDAVNNGKKPFVNYPARRLLGLSEQDQEMIRNAVIEHLEKGAGR